MKPVNVALYNMWKNSCMKPVNNIHVALVVRTYDVTGKLPPCETSATPETACGNIDGILDFMQ